MRSTHMLLVTAACLLTGTEALSARSSSRVQRAHVLLQDALRRAALGSFEQRRVALQKIEHASRLAPGDTTILHALGRFYVELGSFHLATALYRRVLRRDARDADALFGLGRVAQLDWLESAAPASLTLAMSRFEEVVEVSPGLWEAWTTLAALRLENGDREAARRAATSALRQAPERPEAQLSAACLGYRSGALGFAESLFHLALPRLPLPLATRFEDIGPLLGQEDRERFEALGREARAKWTRKFWSENDPDPTSSPNRARLEFWSRLAHAFLLLGDAWSPHWSGRTELYARYGRKVQIQDPMLPRHYEMPLFWGEYPPSPDPVALASLGQNATRGGTAIFAPLPPGKRELPIAAFLATFEGDQGARVVAEIETPGGPADALRAECVVIGADEREVARGSRTLSPSACEPTEVRTAEFPLDLGPGRYRLSFSVRDEDEGYGALRIPCDVGGPASALALSDVVLTCGTPDRASGPGSFRLSPNLPASVQGEGPLVAYFEIYHLRTDAQHGNRFEYEYEVYDAEEEPRSRERGGRSRALLSFHAPQEGFGETRRQYVQVPVGTLAPGRYRLVITVRDLASGLLARGSAHFAKLRPRPATR